MTQRHTFVFEVPEQDLDVLVELWPEDKAPTIAFRTHRRGTWGPPIDGRDESEPTDAVARGIEALLDQAIDNPDPGAKERALKVLRESMARHPAGKGL